MKITMSHGSGGKATSELIENIFARYFSNPVLNRMEDSAILPGDKTLAMTTDSFVVAPLFFPGGDIGRLCVCGTVNDLAVSGAVPKYLTCGFILEEGADTETLEKIASSMADTAKEAGVLIVAGDTKVIEGNGNIYINTAGVGFVPSGVFVSAANAKAGDSLLVSGNLGDHHAAILSARLNIQNEIKSDCAPLHQMTSALLKNGVAVKAMRDITRGGLATVLNEIAGRSHCCISIDETKIPVSDAVRGFCGILGLDPLYMGNEGKLAVIVPASDADKALSVLRQSPYGKNAAIIGNITNEQPDTVLLRTAIGGTRILNELYGEGLPRIC